MPNIEKHGAGWSYRMSYTVDGKRRYKRATGFPTKEAAEAAYNAELTRRKRNPVDVGALTVEGWLEYWFENHAAMRLSENTLLNYEYAITMIVDKIGHLPLAGLRTADIQPLVSAWSKAHSPTTVRSYIKPLSTSLNAAIKLSYISYNPCSALTMPRVKSAPRGTLTQNQVAALLEHVSDRPHLYAAILIASATGMRRGEVSGLKWADIDEATGAISVVRARVQDIKGEVRESGVKTKGSIRVVDIPPTIVDELLACRALQPDGTEYVVSIDGEPTRPDYLSQALTKALKRLDLPHIPFHGLRHSHASIMLALGVHPKVVQERLGHKDIRTTLNIYSHLTRSMQKDSAKLIADAILPAPKLAPKNEAEKSGKGKKFEK